MGTKSEVNEIDNAAPIPIGKEVWACLRGAYRVIYGQIVRKKGKFFTIQGCRYEFGRSELFLKKNDALDELIRRISTVKDNNLTVPKEKTRAPKVCAFRGDLSLNGDKHAV